MKISFSVDAIGAAANLTVLTMGAIGLLVLIPIFCILWTWNTVAALLPRLMPEINSWQAILLYLAFAAMIYLSGLISIHIETDLD